jgi:hypothetical protein
MTDKEIVRALRCISTVCSATDRDCLKCGYFRKWFGCDADRLSTDAADLIERLTAVLRGAPEAPEEGEKA